MIQPGSESVCLCVTLSLFKRVLPWMRVQRHTSTNYRSLSNHRPLWLSRESTTITTSFVAILWSAFHKWRCLLCSFEPLRVIEARVGMEHIVTARFNAYNLWQCTKDVSIYLYPCEYRFSTRTSNRFITGQSSQRCGATRRYNGFAISASYWAPHNFVLAECHLAQVLPKYTVNCNWHNSELRLPQTLWSVFTFVEDLLQTMTHLRWEMQCLQGLQHPCHIPSSMLGAGFQSSHKPHVDGAPSKSNSCSDRTEGWFASCECQACWSRWV